MRAPRATRKPRAAPPVDARTARNAAGGHRTTPVPAATRRRAAGDRTPPPPRPRDRDPRASPAALRGRAGDRPRRDPHRAPVPRSGGAATSSTAAPPWPTRPRTTGTPGVRTPANRPCRTTWPQPGSRTSARERNRKRGERSRDPHSVSGTPWSPSVRGPARRAATDPVPRPCRPDSNRTSRRPESGRAGGRRSARGRTPCPAPPRAHAASDRPAPPDDRHGPRPRASVAVEVSS